VPRIPRAQHLPKIKFNRFDQVSLGATPAALDAGLPELSVVGASSVVDVAKVSLGGSSAALDADLSELSVVVAPAIKAGAELSVSFSLDPLSVSFVPAPVVPLRRARVLCVGSDVH
jgi:hypothetical protein